MNPMLKLFTSPTLAEVLSFLILHPEEEFYQSDLAKKNTKGFGSGSKSS